MTNHEAKSRSRNQRVLFKAGQHSRLAFAIFAIVLLLNILFLTKNYYWDGIFFAQIIEDARGINASLIHPSHLYNHFLVYLIYRAVKFAGLNLRGLNVFQITNCLFSAVSAVVFFKICIRLFQSLYVSVIATAVFSFSAAWWRFSTDANAYILAVLLLLVSFSFMLPGEKSRPVVVAVTHSAAMLIHQLSVFFFPVAVVGLLLQPRRVSRHERALNVAKYSFVTITITLAAYYATFRSVAGPSSFSRFVAWSTYFSPEHGFTFSAWSNLIYSLRAQWRVLFGGRIAFIREFSNFQIYALIAITLALMVAFFVQLFRGLAEFRGSVRRTFEGRSSVILLGAAWIVPYIIFLFFFIPQNVFYRLLYLPAIILIFAACLSAIERRPSHTRRYRAALFATTFFAANLTFSQYPYSQARANPPLELAWKLNQAWPTGTTIYFDEMNSDSTLVKYFNPQTNWIKVNGEQVESLTAQVNRKPVWIDTTLIDRVSETAEGRDWLARRALERTEYELVNSKYRIRFIQLKP